MVGEYKNNGRKWHEKDGAIKVNTHDFIDPNMPKAVPYGIYDVGNDSGWVNVRISADTAEFAVSIVEVSR